MGNVASNVVRAVMVPLWWGRRAEVDDGRELGSMEGRDVPSEEEEAASAPGEGRSFSVGSKPIGEPVAPDPFHPLVALPSPCDSRDIL